MGFKTYRFSISWSRIIPEGTGAVNPKGIEYYNNVINECLKYGIEPLVHLYKYDMPAFYIEELGGLKSPTTNQRMYEVKMSRELDEDGNPVYGLEDITNLFWK